MSRESGAVDPGPALDWSCRRRHGAFNVEGSTAGVPVRYDCMRCGALKSAGTGRNQRPPPPSFHEVNEAPRVSLQSQTFPNSDEVVIHFMAQVVGTPSFRQIDTSKEA